MTPVSVSEVLGEHRCHIVIFLYKMGEALLDASIRPFISTAVCSDMLHGQHPRPPTDQDYHTHLGMFTSRKDDHLDHLGYCGGGGGAEERGHANHTGLCCQVLQLPSEPPATLDRSKTATANQTRECRARDETLGRLVKTAHEVQRQVASILVVYRLLVSVPAFLLGLFCGAWSDARGFKLPMMAPSAGSCAAVVFYLLSVHVQHGKVALLLAGAVMQGAFGKTAMVTMAVNSHVARTSDSEHRTRRLGRLLASSYLGMFVGALLAGVLQGVSSLTNALTVVSVCHALCVFAVLVGVTEVQLVSEHAKRNNPFLESASDSIDPEHPEGVGDQDVTVLVVSRPPLSWSPHLYGYLQAADSGATGLSLLLLLPLLARVLHVPDTDLALLGLTCRLVRVLWAGFCSRTWMTFASVVCGAVGAVLSPALRSLLTETVRREEVGKLFSIQASLETLSKLIGSGVFTGIYAATVDLLPAAAYLCQVVVYLGMVGLLFWLGRLLKDDEACELLLTQPQPRYSAGEAAGTYLYPYESSGSVHCPRFVSRVGGNSTEARASSSSSSSFLSTEEELSATRRKDVGGIGTGRREGVFCFGGALTP
ncbi:proton-coupled folate transporter-like [Babylonia areolata]|uniref:proton-coupled folate transporter-like n=1 Tax=Babylonia areolata TaxID=304850 RepID=UPI003FD5CC68